MPDISSRCESIGRKATVLCIAAICRARTQCFPSSETPLAFPTSSAQSREAHAVPFTYALYVPACFHNAPYSFMTRNKW